MEGEAYPPSSSSGGGPLICPLCGHEYKRAKYLSAHMKRCQKFFGRDNDCFKGRYKCEFCDTYFSRLTRLEEHIRKIHPAGKQSLLFSCGICEEGFVTEKELREHRAVHIKTNEFTLLATAFRRHAMHLRAFFDIPLTMDEAVAHCVKTIPPVLETALVYNKIFKCSVIIFVELYKVDARGVTSRIDIFPFRSQAFLVRPFNNFKPDLTRAIRAIVEQVDEFLYQVRFFLFGRIHPVC